MHLPPPPCPSTLFHYNESVVLVFFFTLWSLSFPFFSRILTTLHTTHFPMYCIFFNCSPSCLSLRFARWGSAVSVIIMRSCRSLSYSSSQPWLSLSELRETVQATLSKKTLNRLFWHTAGGWFCADQARPLALCAKVDDATKSGEADVVWLSGCSN